MTKANSLLVSFFQNPSIVKNFNNKQWELLIAQARASQLLGCLAHQIECNELKKVTPEKALNHLNAANLVSLRQKQQTIRELFEIKKLFSKQTHFLAVLKGAAYIILDLPNHHGRTFSDIDLITSKKELKEVEYNFLFNDWMHSDIDDYDDQYYRKWMHEIPPLYHRKRKSVIDLHHNILPLTNKNYFDGSQFNYQTSSVDRIGDITVLANEDLLIHTAVHLFTEGEFHHGLRDLVDLYLLMKHFEEKEQDFLIKTLKRSQHLKVDNYLVLAFIHVRNTFKLTFDDQLNQAIDTHNTSKKRIINYCFSKVLIPNHSSAKTLMTSIAEFILYWRGHFIRMPLYMLIPHLWHKTFITPVTRYKKEKQQNNESNALN